MKTQLKVNNDVSAASVAGPAVIIVLMLLLGATVYLWRARYIRSTTAYVMMALLVIGIASFGVSLYNS